MQYNLLIKKLPTEPDPQIALYLALRNGRICGKKTFFISHPTTDDNGIKYNYDINYALYKIYNNFSTQQKKIIQPYFIAEIKACFENFLEKFTQGPWYQSILNKTLTQGQYIQSLFNLYQYVQYTTRLCARAVAHSDDRPLRNHYLQHLKGEINHEIIIEQDLQHLGADLEYLRTAHVPDLGTKKFMAIQESTIGFYQDPILMLACPLTAEGISAHMPAVLIKNLNYLISSWGIKKPEAASRFLASHIQFDGGDDGHWQQVLNIIEKYITSEYQLQKFLSILYTAQDGFYSSFNDSITHYQIFANLDALYAEAL
jgi:hypothetical protein